MTDTLRAAQAFLASPRSGQPFTTDVQQAALGLRYRDRHGIGEASTPGTVLRLAHDPFAALSADPGKAVSQPRESGVTTPKGVTPFTHATTEQGPDQAHHTAHVRPR